MVEQQTWMTLVGSAAFAVAMAGLLLTIRRDLMTAIVNVRTDLKSDIAQVDHRVRDFRAELKGDIADLRTELKEDIADLKTDIGRVDSRLTTLENRTYDISARLPPAPASTA